MSVASTYTKLAGAVNNLGSTLSQIYNNACGDWMLDRLGQSQHTDADNNVYDESGQFIYNQDMRHEFNKGGAIVWGISSVLYALPFFASTPLPVALAASGIITGASLAIPNLHAAARAASYGINSLRNPAEELTASASPAGPI